MICFEIVFKCNVFLLFLIYKALPFYFDVNYNLSSINYQKGVFSFNIKLIVLVLFLYDSVLMKLNFLIPALFENVIV